MRKEEMAKEMDPERLKVKNKTHTHTHSDSSVIVKYVCRLVCDNDQQTVHCPLHTPIL